MKLILLYDSPKGYSIASIISNKMKQSGNIVIEYDCSKDKLDGCLGCFGCWIKTPGICVQKKTDSHLFLKDCHDADYLICISKITFGGFSSLIKSYIDRIIPLSQPFFKRFSGEMHHVKRYKTQANILAVGYDASSKNAETVFLNYTKANLTNSGANNLKFSYSFIYKNDENEFTLWINSIGETK